MKLKTGNQYQKPMKAKARYLERTNRETGKNKKLVKKKTQIMNAGNEGGAITTDPMGIKNLQRNTMNKSMHTDLINGEMD